MADTPPSLTNEAVPGYAIGLIADVHVNEDLLSYMAQIESTMAEFGGRWLVHGTRPDIREGDWAGDVIIIEFRDPTSARAWYESEAYQRIARLRTENSTSWIALLDGVAPGYAASSTIEMLRATAAPKARASTDPVDDGAGN
jgi:uncharacterized protein (DUF1330 family)